MNEGHSVIDVLRAVAARRQAIYAYAQAHDHFSEQEQTFTAEGRAIEAAGAHEYALMVLRAYRAELDNPEPVPVIDPIDNGRNDR